MNITKILVGTTVLGACCSSLAQVDPNWYLVGSQSPLDACMNDQIITIGGGTPLGWLVDETQTCSPGALCDWNYYGAMYWSDTKTFSGEKYGKVELWRRVNPPVNVPTCGTEGCPRVVAPFNDKYWATYSPENCFEGPGL